MFRIPFKAKMKKKVIIDVATIHPGQGGAGGGIWSYAGNLLLHLDQQVNAKDIEIVCLVNSQFNLPLKNLKKKEVQYNLKNLAIRFFYTNIYLPVYVYRKRAILHKLYFDSPILPLTKTLVTIHDCMGDFYRKKKYLTRSLSDRFKFIYFGLINKRAIKQSNFINTPSNFIKDEIMSCYGVPGDKIIVTPLAAQENNNEAFSKNKCSDTLNMYCVAAFHKHKGHLRLLEIFETLVKKYNVNAHLYFRGHVGDKDFYEQIHSKIALSDVKAHIHILEYEKQSSLQKIYLEADWVILLSEYEGFGLPVIEAQANKVPVICSDIPTFREVAGESVFYLKEIESVNEATENLNSILKNEDLKKQLIERGLRNAAKYNWGKVARQVLDIYIQAST